MTGQELIDYIQEGKLQDRHFFIDVEGYFSNPNKASGKLCSISSQLSKLSA